MKVQDANFIHPEDNTNFSYWSRKLGVSSRQLNDAILYTGSLSATRIKDYLKENTAYNTPLLLVWKALKSKIKFIS